MTGALLVIAITFAVGGGLAVQAQLNGALTDRTGSAVLVTLISFLVGTAILLPYLLIRRQLPTWKEAVSWRWRRWWLLGGPLGAFIVVAISTGVPLLGVALATVLTVAGQTVTGIILDSLGSGVGNRIRITGTRLAAVTVAMSGLAVTVFAVPGVHASDGLQLSVMIVVLVVAGIASALQQAANGEIAGVSGNPAFAAFVSFFGGFLVLAVLAAVLWAFGQRDIRWPPITDEWFLYSGGLLGTLFVVTAAWAVRKIGVLALALAVVAGQIVTAVALDLITGAAPVGLATTVSILAIVVAVVLAVLPARRSRDEKSTTQMKETSNERH